jgi:serine/threonine protein kinase, bacterial
MALPALVSRENPGSFGAFRLLEQLGQGGMAIVYRAQQEGARGFQRDVVLKAMLPSLIKSAPLVEMFEAEARLTAQLRHPNIVQVEDFGVAGGIPYLIMEFLDGRNLSQLRNALHKLKRRLPIGVAVSVARDLCMALGYAHQFVASDGRRMQIIHRDVSPSNVMVLRDGTVRLLDFGVAKMSSEAGQAVTTSLKGKFAYMAPEQVNQEPIDRRCDVFAAGIVLHEMLVGKRLFGTKSELETLRRVSLAEAAPPSLANPEVPPALDAVVMRALSRHPSDRYDSGREMAAALEALGLAAPRRALAQLIAEIAPPPGGSSVPRLVEVEELLDEDTELSGPGEPADSMIEGVTDPEHAVSAPHLVLMTGDEAIVDDRAVTGEIITPEPIEIEAEPSLSRMPLRSVEIANLHDDAEPTGKAPARPIGAPASSEPEVRALPAAETIAAPIEDLRPTRIYDAANPAVARARAAVSGVVESRAGRDDFEARPTKVYDASEEEPTREAHAVRIPSTPTPLPPPIVRPISEPAVVIEADRIAVSAQAAGPSPATPSSPALSDGPGGLNVPTAFTGFEPEAPKTSPPPRRRRSVLPWLVVPLLIVAGVGAGLYARAYLRRAPIAAPAASPGREPATQANRIELAAPPTPEPRLPAPDPTSPGPTAPAAAVPAPAAAPTPAAATPAGPESGVSLVGLDRRIGSPRAAAAAVTPPADNGEPAEQGATRSRSTTRGLRRSRPPAEGATEPTPKAPAASRSTVKEGRIVDPFETEE